MERWEKGVALAIMIDGIACAIIQVVLTYQMIYVEGCDWTTGTNYPGIWDVVFNICFWAVFFGIGLVPTSLICLAVWAVISIFRKIKGRAGLTCSF